MTAAQAIQQLLSVEEERREGWCHGDKLVVAAARVGAGSTGGTGSTESTGSTERDGKAERFVCGTLSSLQDVDVGPPLHSLVLIGRRTHALEREMLREWVVGGAEDEFERIWSRDYST